MKWLFYFFKLRMKTTLVLFSFFVLIISCTSQDNWNQYLGHKRNATVENIDLPEKWPDSDSMKKWEFELGPGYGGAAIYDDEVFILDREKGEKDILRCIDFETGKEKWNFSYAAGGELPYPGSRAVPCVGEEFIWSVGPHGHFHCIDKTTHQSVWFYDIKKEFKAELPNWGFSQSPLVYNDLVIVAPQGENAGVVAFDKKTGKIVWKSRPLSGYNFHVSPQLASFGGVDQVIMISPYNRRDSTQTHEVVSFDATNGQELWTYNGLTSFATITPATVIENNRLFLTDCSYNGNYDPVSVLLKISKEGEDFTVRQLFKTEEAGCKMHPAVFYNDHFYLNNTGRPGGMTCLNLKGEVVWEPGNAPNFELGALLRVGDLIVNQNGKNGDIHLIKPSPDGYIELGKASFFEAKKSQAWSPLAFSDGKLIIRDMEKMVCVDLN